MASSNAEAELAKRRSEVVEWLHNLLPDFNMSPESSEDELRLRLIDDTSVLSAILQRASPAYSEEIKQGMVADTEIIKKFISAVEQMGLPVFELSDIEQGQMTPVVNCLWALKDHLNADLGNARGMSRAKIRWKNLENNKLRAVEKLRAENGVGVQNSILPTDEKKSSFAFSRSFRNVVMSEPTTPQSHHSGHKFHELFQLKQGQYYDLPAAKISEMTKSNSFDNAPTQSLLSVANGILDESIERKNGEIPHRVSWLLRKVVLEIERRISTQAEHIRNQNNLFKAREEKYLSRIRALETLSAGTTEEAKTEKEKIEEKTKIGEEDFYRLMNEKEHNDMIILELEKQVDTMKKSYLEHLQQLEAKTGKNMETTKNSYNEQYEQSELKARDTEIQLCQKIKEMETTNRLYREQYEQLEAKAKDIEMQLCKKIEEIEITKSSSHGQYEKLEVKAKDTEMQLLKKIEDLDAAKSLCHGQYQQLEEKSKNTEIELNQKITEVETLLNESRKKIKDLETTSESKIQSWKKKVTLFQDSACLQYKLVQDLKLSFASINHEVADTQKRWSEEVVSFGKQLKLLTDATENYHVVLAENRKLYNEILELKGNIRVYCRVRPFLGSENRKQSTIDITADDELVLVNHSKSGKDGQKMFKFNKVFGPSCTQEEVFLDTQPLIRSVLDGYNVCIFAYGQTGSGKTYTMIGPNSATEKEWGVNYRALNDLFQISKERQTNFKYEVGVQMVEIYNEQVRDLLTTDNSKKLGILTASQPNGVAVPDASMLPVSSTSDVLDLMHIGLNNRAVSATALNERSSRSHSVVTVHVRGTDLRTGTILRGSLHLVDLAGSERVDRSEVTGDRLREAQHINKSLSALGDVIFSLSQKSAHVPYRNSKLTQVLQSSLGGHAKTLMFVQLNPDLDSYSETSSTLKFAERVSGIELGAAQSQREGKDVRDLVEQVATLQNTIAKKNEEIERLQMTKDSRSKITTADTVTKGGKPINLKQSASSPNLARSIECDKSSNGIMAIKSKAILDHESLSEYSGENSEGESQQSIEDMKRQRDVSDHRKPHGEDASQSSADLDTDLGDADSEERPSDFSDTGTPMGTKTNDSVGNTVEHSQFPNRAKTSETLKDQKPKLAARISKPPMQKTSTTAARPTQRLKETTKSLFSGLKKVASSPTTSLTKSLKSTSTLSKPATSTSSSSKRWQ